MSLPKLYLITNRFQTLGRPLERVVSDACKAGCRMIQIRERNLSDQGLLDLLTILISIIHTFQGVALVNDRLDLCQATGADGVHCKVTSPPVSTLRKRLPTPRVIGASTHNLEQAKQAEGEGADFIVFGPIYDTPSKRPYGKPLGLERLSKITTRVSIPVYALGGITRERIPAVLLAGAYGVAMISAICEATEVGKATQEILEALS